MPQLPWEEQHYQENQNIPHQEILYEYQENQNILPHEDQNQYGFLDELLNDLQPVENDQGNEMDIDAAIANADPPQPMGPIPEAPGNQNPTYTVRKIY